MASKPPPLHEFISPGQLARIIDAAIDEDLGPARRDITSELLIPASVTAHGRCVARQQGVVAGLALLHQVAAAFHPQINVQLKAHDADHVQPHTTLAHVQGPLRALLAAERTMLNLLTHLSGIATLTQRYVELAQNRAAICDTRKTTPGLRSLEKYAVACGGATNHRMGLFDAVLVKDNHLTAWPERQWTTPLADAVRRARAGGDPPLFVEVEVDTLEQLQLVLEMPADAVPDIILLDNMTTDQLAQAVAMRQRLAPQVQLEASGGVTADTINAIAAAGVDRIAVGAITHSAPALDIGLDIQPQ